jgi:outer membrane protein TolC
MFRKIIQLLLFLLPAANCLQAQTAVLDDYLRQAVSNNPQLNDYRNQVQASAFDSLHIKAARKPQVNMIGQIMYAPLINGYGYDNAVTNTGNYELLVGVSQNILNKQILAPQFESSRLQALAAGNSASQSEHDLQRSVTAQYITAYSDIIQINYLRNTVNLLHDESGYLKQFVERGVYKAFDYTTFLVSLESLYISLRQEESQYRSDVYALNLLCGISDTTLPQLAPPPVKSNPNVGVTSSRFLNTYRIDSFQISNRRLLSAVNYKPRLSWFADAGILGSRPEYLYQNFGTSFGLNFSMPIYDGKQKQLEYKKIGLAESTRMGYQQFFKKQYQQEISSILRQMSENESLIIQVNKQLRLSEDQLLFGKTQLNIGALPVSDFILALRNNRDIRNTLSQLMVKQMQLTNEFNYWNW